MTMPLAASRLLLLHLLLLALGLVRSDLFPSHAKDGRLWQLVQAETSLLVEADAQQLWFTQRIDHFASDSADLAPAAGQPANATFQQRYYEVETYWTAPHGPVILYIGGEGALEHAPAGFVQVLAQKFGAKILALEHRFYGQSVPNGDLSTKNYRYLTVQQALADLKYFKESYQQLLGSIHGVENQWIAIGGSYPGALSAWFRVAYPNTTVASLSSSGVVQPVYSFHEFDEQVALSVGPPCAGVLRQTTAAFEQQLAAGNGTRVKGLLGAEALADADFFYMLADAAAMAVQYGHKDVVCDHMVGAFERKEPLVEAFANFTLDMYGADFGSGCFYDTNCLAKQPSRWGDGRSWRWQKCSQVAYFQVAPEHESLRSAMVNLSYHKQQCEAVFGDVVHPAKGVQEITQLYGGKHPTGHKIFFSNGGDDPWQRASVLSSPSEDEVANVAKCELCGHCGDLRADPDSPEPLLKQREEILKYLTKWLAEDSNNRETAEDVEQQFAVTTDEDEQEQELASRHRSSPLVLVPIVFAFVALLVVLHADIVVRDAPMRRTGHYQDYHLAPTHQI